MDAGQADQNHPVTSLGEFNSLVDALIDTRRMRAVELSASVTHCLRQVSDPSAVQNICREIQADVVAVREGVIKIVIARTCCRDSVTEVSAFSRAQISIADHDHVRFPAICGARRIRTALPSFYGGVRGITSGTARAAVRTALRAAISGVHSR